MVEALLAAGADPNVKDDYGLAARRPRPSLRSDRTPMPGMRTVGRPSTWPLSSARPERRARRLRGRPALGGRTRSQPGGRRGPPRPPSFTPGGGVEAVPLAGVWEALPTPENPPGASSRVRPLFPSCRWGKAGSSGLRPEGRAFTWWSTATIPPAPAIGRSLRPGPQAGRLGTQRPT
jgi:hypothetical protein